MREFDRRQFLSLAGLGALTIPSAALLSGCGGSDPAPTGAAGGASAASSGAGVGAPVGKIKLALSSSTLPTYITQLAGPLLYGKDFGLSVAKDDIVTFQSHATAVQAVLSGQLQAVGASTMANLSVIAQGSPFKLFAPYILVDTYIIASTGDITTLADIKAKKATVAVDSEGGAARSGMDAILVGKKAGFLVGELENVQGIESSGGRASALENGQAQVALIHIYQANKLTAAGKKVNNLGSLYESVPQYLKECYAAPQAWLDGNQATAAALTASVLKASRELSASEETFMSAVKELIPQPPADDQLKLSFDLIKKYQFWPTTVTGLEPERLQFMLDLGKQEGLLTNPSLSPTSVVDSRPMDAALKMIGGSSSGSSGASSSSSAAPTTGTS
jgi:ABC-type nitrate/sulfonate/bicarbonate transport system substrate-binding protein